AGGTQPLRNCIIARKALEHSQGDRSAIAPTLLHGERRHTIAFEFEGCRVLSEARPFESPLGRPPASSFASRSRNDKVPASPAVGPLWARCGPAVGKGISPRLGGRVREPCARQGWRPSDHGGRHPKWPRVLRTLPIRYCSAGTLLRAAVSLSSSIWRDSIRASSRLRA